MNSRERVKSSIDHERPDRIACGDSIWPDALTKWHSQGMPDDITPDDYFSYDISTMSIDCSPRYEQKILEKGDIWYSFQDRWGYSAKKKLGASSTIKFFDQKTINKDTWHATKHRWVLDRNDTARIDRASYFEHFTAYPTWDQAIEIYTKIYAEDRYMHFAAYGPWEATWRHRGYERLLMDTALDPEWVKDMADTHIDLLISILGQCLSLNMRPDGFYMIEDLAETRTLLFSPVMWRQVFKPGIARLGDYLRKYKIDFWMHSCGNISALIPDLIECGVTVLNPLQDSAGLNVNELRKIYGKSLAYYGNISVPKMSGPIDILEEEIRSKVWLAKEGGYIYHSDHSVPPDVDFDRYEWILATVRKYGSY